MALSLPATAAPHRRRPESRELPTDRGARAGGGRVELSAVSTRHQATGSSSAFVEPRTSPAGDPRMERAPAPPVRPDWTRYSAQVRAGRLFLVAIAVLAIPAAWAAATDTCSEAAWLVPFLASTGLAALAIFVFGLRRGHPILGVVGALVGGGLWSIVAFLVAFIVWIPFVPDRCTYDFGI